MSVSVIVAHGVALACLVFSNLSSYLVICGFFLLLLSLAGVLSGFYQFRSCKLASMKWDLDARHMQLIDTEGEAYDVASIRRIAVAPHLLVLCVQCDRRRLYDWLVIASDSVDQDTFRRLRVALSLAPAVELPSRGS
ncbi:protein YgfX [Nitrincola alkalilacustris]|uniref:protein YgfX n=1 Tax=Nitrincola alkalilacustris TaxID=1571224 RepID=UPI0030B83D11